MEVENPEVDSLKVICARYPLESLYTLRSCEPLGHLHSPAKDAYRAVRGADQIGGFLPLARCSAFWQALSARTIKSTEPTTKPSPDCGPGKASDQPKEEHNSARLFRIKFQAVFSAF